MRKALLIAAALLSSTSAFAQTDRSVLPVPQPAFDGQIGETALDSKPGSARPVQAPQGAPNVLLFMSDDVGFAMSSAFGGPVPTPNMERLAAQGQRYNRFHTTGICSPSRAALLTGRNHHNAGVGFLSDIASNYPGYGGRILPETATVAQILRLNGYNTAMFGKHHNVPSGERSPAGPFDAWPTGIGFEYFFGFPYGDTDQYDPIMYRGTTRVDPDESYTSDGGQMLDKRLANDVIRWVHNQKAAAPDKPFLVYMAPGSTHAPHQAPVEYITRFRGKFDQGWDRMRDESFRRQLAMGIVPRGTRLTARPDAIPAWDSLTPDKKAFAARSMEVAAAQLVYQDEQLGRVLDELQRMGVLGNTLVAVIQGDNGASGEAGPKGTINELRDIGVHDEDEEWLEENTGSLGGPMTYGNYPVGWAWAMNTPLRWVKQYSSMLGGVRNDMILSWPGHVARPGTICSQFSHLVDITPTILEAAKLPMPDTVYGARQKPFDGQSLLPSLASCDGAKPRTQYFEINGKVGLYSEGWFLSGEDGRPSWLNVGPGGARPPMNWSLYNLDKDFSQSTDLAKSEPVKLQAMQDLWKQEAERNHVFPLEHRFGAARANAGDMMSPRKHWDFWGKFTSIPAQGAGMPFLAVRSFTVNADLVLDKADSSGAVLAWGSRFGGWSLLLDHGKPTFVWSRSTDPKEGARIAASEALAKGPARLTMRFASQGFGKGADVILSSGGRELARGSLPGNMLMPAGGGETLDVGRDIGVTVTDYATRRGNFEGDVPHVTIDFD